MLLLGASAFLLAFSCSTSPALAESAKEQARTLFRKGNEMFLKGEYKAALKLYLEARVLYPSHRIDLNIGGALEKLERFTEEAVYIQCYLRQAGNDEPPERIRKARKRMGVLQKILVSVSVVCQVKGAKVLMNGKVLGRTPMQASAYLKPGTHLLVVEKKDYAAYSKELKLSAGQHLVVDVSLKPARSSSQPTARLSRANRTGDRLGFVNIKASILKRRKAKTVWGFAAMGISLACAATAGILYGVGLTQGNEAHSDYMTAADKQPPSNFSTFEGNRESVTDARDKLIAGHVLVGVAAAAMGVSIYQFVTRPTVGKLSSREGDAALVGVVPGSDSLIMVWGKTF